MRMAKPSIVEVGVRISGMGVSGKVEQCFRWVGGGLPQGRARAQGFPTSFPSAQGKSYRFAN